MACGEWRESVPSLMNDDTIDWPLHKITEPHDSNDVILSLPELHSRDYGSDNGSEEKEESPIPWRSFSSNRRDHRRNDGWEFLQGNQRFLKLLAQHQEEYEKRSQMEKPLLTVQILQQWRNQSPPGRFLVMESDTHPPLWKDVGDRKARAKISKAFKSLSKNGSAGQIVGSPASLSLSSSNPEPKDNSPTPTTAFVHEAEVNALQKANPMQPGKCISISSITATTSTGSTTTIQQEEKSGDVEKSCCLGEEETKLSDSERELAPVANIVRAHREAEENKRAALLDISSGSTGIVKPPVLPARFQKPEKFTRRISEQLHSVQEGGTVIYGRQKEQEQLATIYQRQKRQRALYQQEGSSSSCAIDLVLISGPVGVGKTSLGQTLRNPLPFDKHNDLDGDQDDEQENKRPFFLYGKFEHCDYSDPTAVFSSIATDFCQQLVQRGDRKLNQRYCDALAETLKDDIAVLTNLVPALDALMKKKNWSPGFCKHSTTGANNEESMDESSTNNQFKEEESQQDSYACLAMERIKEVFGLFLQAIASVDSDSQSIIVMWDDIHWAKKESALDILISLVTDKTSCGILFLGAYKQDEAEKPRIETSLRLLKTSPHLCITKIQLEDLEEDSVHCMLADALSLTEGETKSLAALAFSLTKGNPTFITELLRGGQERGILQFHEATQQWTCDIEKMPSCLGNIHSFSDLVKAKVLSLPNTVQETLKIAACLLSSHINESALRMIDTVGALSSHLKYLDIRGLLTCRHGHYAFASDSVKHATYDLIPEKERASYHLRIGQRLWLHLKENQNTNFYSLLMGQIMMGDELIKEDADRRAVAALCLDAGRKAAKYLGFQTAWVCLSHGIKIVSAQKTWGRDNYDLSLSLFNTAIEVCYCNGRDFSQLEDLISEVLENARTFEDSLTARSTLIYAKGSRGLQLEAIELGIATLSHLEETFPSTDPRKLRVYWEGRRVRNMLKGLSDEDILRLPRMKDPKKLAAMQILNHVILYAVYAKPTLWALMSFRMVELTIRHGLSALSSVGFVMYGAILCRYDRIDDGFRYGKLSLKIGDHFKKAVWLCRTWAGYYGTIACRKLPIQSALEPLRTAEKAGIRCGDIEFATLNACFACWYGAKLLPLPVLEHDLRSLAGRVLLYGQTLALVMIKPLWQMALNLMGKVEDPNILQGGLVDDDIAHARGGQNPCLMVWVCFFQMKVSFLLGDYDKAEKFSHTTRDIYENSAGCVDGGYTLFWECMTLLAQARRGKRRYRVLAYVRRRLKRLKYWALHAPTNFLGKQFLLEAEVAWIRGDRGKASSHYHSAILHSREAGFIAEEALANEQLGRYFIDLKQPDCAVPHLKAARELYKKWGATAVLERFEEEFCSLLEITS